MFLMNFSHRVWKFHNFPAPQILREINFEETRSSKSAVFGKFQPTKSVEIHKDLKSSASKGVKIADFALLESLNLISRKILVI